MDHSSDKETQGNDFGKTEDHPLLNVKTTPISSKPDIGKILLFSFSLMTLSIAQNFEFSILGSFISKGLGTDSYAAFTATNSILSFVIYMYIIATYGITSRLADEIGAGNTLRVGKRVNIATIAALIYGILIAIFCFALKTPLFKLFDIRGSVVDIAHSYFNLRLISVPMVVMQSTMMGALQGFHSVPVFVFQSLLIIAVDISGSYLCIYHFGYRHLTGIGYSLILSNTLGCVVGLTWIYRPSNIKRYALNSFKIEKELIFSFIADSGYLLGKGIVIFYHLTVKGGMLMLLYFSAPVVAGHLGLDELAGYGILIQLSLYSTSLSDSVGLAGNMICAYYIGSKRYSDLLRFSIFLPIIGFVLFSCGLGLLLYFLEPYLIALFTKDPQVIIQLKGAWLGFYFHVDICLMFVAIVFTQLFTGVVGIYEGLMYSAKMFKALFWVQFIGATCIYLPFLVANLYVWRKLVFLMMAVGLFQLVRVVPLVFYVHVNMRRKYTVPKPVTIN